MMLEYTAGYIRANKFKVGAVIVSMALYFALMLLAVQLHRAVPDIAALPLKSVGVQTIVQKTGKIPEQMQGVVFPHSNAPMTASEYNSLSSLSFVEDEDVTLFFWQFDDAFFKSVAGVDPEGAIIARRLVEALGGAFSFQPGNAVVLAALAERYDLQIGDALMIGDHSFRIEAILDSHPSGNIIAADVYIPFDDAVAAVRSSSQMSQLYDLNDVAGNVVMLRTDPSFDGDKSKLIKALGDNLLVFSEESFTKEITEQLALVSGAGQVFLVMLGIILMLAFSLLMLYILKVREVEIAVLRRLGWKIADLKHQFVTENILLLVVGIVLGLVMNIVGIAYLKSRTIAIHLPWDITAKPHFLPEENNINRVVETQIPISFDPVLAGILALGTTLVFLVIAWLIFTRIRYIQPDRIR